MKRFLSTTAILVALTGTAYADGHAAKFDTVTIEQSDFFASDLIGMRIYNAEGQEMDEDQPMEAGAQTEWDDIGEINDVILTAEGDVKAVILGVGGFLGMGEKDVSVSMDDIKIMREDGNENNRFLVVSTSKETLENAPSFQREMTMDDEDKTDQNQTAATEEDGDDANMTQTAAADTDTMQSKEEMQKPNLTRPAMQLDGYQEAEAMEVQQLASDDIEGSYVYGVNDETVGEIDALLMDADGKVKQAVINIGGFLGLGEKPVAVDFERIQVLRSEDGEGYRFYIDSTEEKLEALPEYGG